jgi:hypothetical protein
MNLFEFVLDALDIMNFTFSHELSEVRLARSLRISACVDNFLGSPLSRSSRNRRRNFASKELGRTFGMSSNKASRTRYSSSESEVKTNIGNRIVPLVIEISSPTLVLKTDIGFVVFHCKMTISRSKTRFLS